MLRTSQCSITGVHVDMQTAAGKEIRKLWVRPTVLRSSSVLQSSVLRSSVLRSSSVQQSSVLRSSSVLRLTLVDHTALLA